MDHMNAQIMRIIEEIRQSQSVQTGLIVQNRELRAALMKAQSDLADVQADTAQVDEAIALLDAMEEEGREALVENTAAEEEEFTPSGN
jgi:predicted negative regulator of RcsB-dependent stress response